MNFLARAQELRDYIIAQRRWLHAHAEPSFKEEQTTRHLVEELESLGIEAETFPDYYGAIGRIHGGKPGKTVMLRADIDALPMEEHSDEPFACRNGCMHACGHDCHAAMLLGAAKLLKEREGELPGTVELLFQSAEESCHGAPYYIEKGCLDRADALFGLHVWSGLPAPYLNIEDGYRMASCDNFKIVVRGNATHGSTPQLGRDAVVAASSIILNLQSYVSRNSDPLVPTVITVGTVRGGSQFNIISDLVEMTGTVRTFSRELRPAIEPGMRRIIEHTAEALGCTAELDYHVVEEPVVNDHIELNEIARAAAVKLFGEDILRPMPRATGSEDFSFLMQKVPGVFGFLGCFDEGCGAVYANHNDRFKVDDNLLYRGAALYAQFAADYLGQNGGGAAE